MLCRRQGRSGSASRVCAAGRGAEKEDFQALSFQPGLSGSAWHTQPSQVSATLMGLVGFFPAKLNGVCLSFFGVSTVCLPLLTLLSLSGSKLPQSGYYVPSIKLRDLSLQKRLLLDHIGTP